MGVLKTNKDLLRILMIFGFYPKIKMVISLSTQGPGNPATTFSCSLPVHDEWYQAEEVISLSKEFSDFSMCHTTFSLEILLILRAVNEL